MEEQPEKTIAGPPSQPGSTRSSFTGTGRSLESSNRTAGYSNGSGSASGDWHKEMEESFKEVFKFSTYVSSLRRIVTVEPVIFLYMFGTYLHFLLLQLYVYNYFAKQLLSNTSFPFPNGSYCLTHDIVDNYTNNGSRIVGARSNHFTLYNTLASQLPSIFLTLVYGPLSDRYGRKPILILVGLGSTLQGVLTVLFVHFNLSVYYLLFPSFVSGLTGDYAGVLSTSFAYVADVSSLRWRTLRIGFVEAMIFAGGALGEGVGGYWYGRLNCYFIPTMLLFIACNFLIVLYSLLVLPESLDKKKRRENAIKRSKGVKSIVQGFLIFFWGFRRYSLWRLWAALIALSILVINITGMTQIQSYFFIDPPLKWEPKVIGYYDCVSQVTHGIGLLVIFPVLMAVGLPDALVGLLGIGVSCTMQVMTGLVRRTWEMFVVGSFAGVESVTSPSIRGILSKLVSAEDQGALLSFVAAVEVASTLAASSLYNLLYPETVKDKGHKYASVFFIMAGLSLVPVPLLVLLLIFRKYKPKEKRVLTTIQEPSYSQCSETENLLDNQPRQSYYESTQSSNTS